MSKNNGKLEASGNKFHVIISDELTLYANKDDAIGDLKDELAKNDDATVAKISYDADGDTEFSIEPLSWKDIATGWATQ